MTEKEPILYNPASEAVADAITTAQSELFFALRQAAGSNWSEDALSTMEQATSGRCAVASVYAIHFLTKKFPDLFSKLATIETHSLNRLAHKGSKPLRNFLWDNHVYFLAQATDATWYAGSPANVTREDAAFIEPFTSKNLTEIMTAIENRDGGVWPSADFIEQSLSSLYKFPTIVTSNDGSTKFTFTHISKMLFNDSVELRTRIIDNPPGLAYEIV